MAFSINTNVASLSAQNYLRVNSDFQNKTIDRVTSGLRIVQSGDDAAGLAIANGFRSDQAVLTQGVRNANDGMSQLQIIDGGMSNISQLLDRCRTLATQSASGTFTGDRSVLNSEFQSVIGEIDRQAQSIGLNTSGIFAKNVSVFIGGGKTSSGIDAVENGSVSVDLSQSTVDSRSLGLRGAQATGRAGTDIGPGSGSTSLAAILANPANVRSETSPNTTTFYLKGPGFDSQGVKITVSTQNMGGAADLVTAINAAIDGAANNGTQQGTALKNGNITAAITTDSNGRQQLAFNSGTAAFQVQAGDQMANALLGNFQPRNAVAQGSDTSSSINVNPALQTISFQINGADVGPITVGSGVTSKTDVMDALNNDVGFKAVATASLNGNQLVIRSNDATAASSVTVIDGGAGSVSRLLGLTTAGDATSSAASPSTGASLATYVMAGAVAGLGSTVFTAADAGNITFRFTGAGLTSPTDVTITTTPGETLSSAVNDLTTQISNNASLKGAGIGLDPNYTVLDGNHQLLFSDSRGQAFNVDVTGDVANQFGFGSFQPGNSASHNTGAVDYTTLTGTLYDPGTATLQGLTAGQATLQFSINGGASNSADNKIDVDLTGLDANAAVVQGSANSGPLNIQAGGAAAAYLASGAGNAGLMFTAKAGGTGGNSITVTLVNRASSGALGVVVSGNDITINLADDGTNPTSTAAQVKTFIEGDASAGAVAARALLNVGLLGATGGTAMVAAAQASLANGAASQGSNNELNLNVSGTAFNIKLTANASTTLNSIADQINQTTGFSTLATATVEDNKLVLTTVGKGAGQYIQVQDGSANTLLGLSGTKYGVSATGGAIKDYLNQQFAASSVLQKAGLQAAYSAGKLTITSNNDTNFRINEVLKTSAGTASAKVAGTASFTTQAIAALVQGGNGGVVGAGGSYTFAAAQDLLFKVDGGATQTAHFGIGTYTKQQVIDAINSQVTGATASYDTVTGKIQLIATTAGAAHNILLDLTANSTANTVLGFQQAQFASGTDATTTKAITTDSNDMVRLKVDGGAEIDIQLAQNLTATATDIKTALNTYFTDASHLVGAVADVDAAGHITIASTSTGLNSSIEILGGANTANTTLGLTAVTVQGSDTNIGYGAYGASFGGNVSSGAPPSSAQIDAGGAAQTDAIAFTPLLYGSDAQTITIAANDASGAQQSLSTVLRNDAGNRSGQSIDQALSEINGRLLQSNNPTLQQIVAVKDNSNGSEQIRFLSSLPSFQVTVGSNANTTGLGASAPGVPTDPAQQGTTLTSNVAEGGGTADISNQSSAQAAVSALSNAVSALGKAQAVVGKGENQLNYAVNLAQSQLTNLATAESRIRDADLASEAANLTKAQILMQAGVAALAQANSAPQQVLSLLQGR